MVVWCGVVWWWDEINSGWVSINRLVVSLRALLKNCDDQVLPVVNVLRIINGNSGGAT